MSCLASASSAGFTSPSGIVTSVVGSHFVGVVQLLHHDHAVEGPEQHQVLLPARRVLAQRRSARVLERRGQQPVRAVASLVGAEVVNFLDVLAVDFGEGDELQDVDHAGRFLFERLELFRRQHHVLVFRELVAFDRVVARYDLAVLRSRCIAA